MPGAIKFITVSATAQVIAIAVSPIVSRVYSPHEFGIFVIFSSCIAVLSSVVTLRLEYALPLVSDHLERHALSKMTMLVSLVMSSILVSIFLYINNLFNLFDVSPYHFSFGLIIFVGLVSNSFNQIAIYLALARSQESSISSAKLNQAIAQAVTHLAGGFLSGSSMFLILGFILNRITGIRRLLGGGFYKLSRNEIQLGFSKAKQQQKLTIYGTTSAIIDAFSVQAMPLILAHIFSPTSAGMYGLTQRVISVPAAILGQAIGQMVYSRTSKALLNNESIAELTEGITARLILVSLPIYGLLALHGEWLFSLVFGKDWSTAGIYAQWLALWLGVSFITAPLSMIPFAKGLQKQGLLINFVELVLRFSALYFSSKSGRSDMTIAAYSLTGLAIVSFYFIWVTKISEVNVLSLIKRIVKPSILIVAILVISKILLTFVQTNFLMLPIVILLGLVLYKEKNTLLLGFK